MGLLLIVGVDGRTLFKGLLVLFNEIDLLKLFGSFEFLLDLLLLSFLHFLF